MFESKVFTTNYAYPIAYSDNIESQHYIDQFLSINDVSFEDSSKEKPRQFQVEEIHTQQQPQIKNQVSGVQSKSVYHNFQKHLVITLRNHVKIGQKTFQSSTKGIQRKLWKEFKECRKPTRTLIFLITGSYLNGSSEEDLKLYGLEKLFCSYPSSIISQAQSNLKEEILRQIQHKNMDTLLNKRRMRNKESFKEYLYTFCDELRNGRFNRRIPKQLKINLTDFEEKLKISGHTQSHLQG